MSQLTLYNAAKAESPTGSIPAPAELRSPPPGLARRGYAYIGPPKLFAGGSEPPPVAARSACDFILHSAFLHARPGLQTSHSEKFDNSHAQKDLA
jgi:hypothetical protein